MAILGSKKEKEVEASAPMAPLSVPAVPKPVPVSAPKPEPKPIPLLMSTDGGLNGQCWRAGQTVVMDASAADFYLAKGYAKRAS